MIYFGIDPGKSGAIAGLWDDGQTAGYVGGNETEKDQSDWLRQFDMTNAQAVIEKVSSSPQMGVKSSFTFGRSYGFLRGLLIAHSVPFVEVSPQRWQREMQCMTKGDKNVTKSRAQQMWPQTKITHKIADAMLLAEYARRLQS